MKKSAHFPELKQAALGANPPLLSGWQINFLKEGEHLAPAQQPSTECEVVSPNYFATLETPLFRGRALDERDTKNAPLVMVIDQTFAEQAFPDRIQLANAFSWSRSMKAKGQLVSSCRGRGAHEVSRLR